VGINFFIPWWNFSKFDFRVQPKAKRVDNEAGDGADEGETVLLPKKRGRNPRASPSEEPLEKNPSLMADIQQPKDTFFWHSEVFSTLTHVSDKKRCCNNHEERVTISYYHRKGKK
jgi:hypothetical protein